MVPADRLDASRASSSRAPQAIDPFVQAFGFECQFKPAASFCFADRRGWRLAKPQSASAAGTRTAKIGAG
jgi:hypothetical protein